MMSDARRCGFMHSMIIRRPLKLQGRGYHADLDEPIAESIAASIGSTLAGP